MLYTQDSIRNRGPECNKKAEEGLIRCLLELEHPPPSALWYQYLQFSNLQTKIGAHTITPTHSQAFWVWSGVPLLPSHGLLSIGCRPWDFSIFIIMNQSLRINIFLKSCVSHWFCFSGEPYVANILVFIYFEVSWQNFMISLIQTQYIYKPSIHFFAD